MPSHTTRLSPLYVATHACRLARLGLVPPLPTGGYRKEGCKSGEGHEAPAEAHPHFPAKAWPGVGISFPQTYFQLKLLHLETVESGSAVRPNSLSVCALVFPPKP